MSVYALGRDGTWVHAECLAREARTLDAAGNREGWHRYPIEAVRESLPAGVACFICNAIDAPGSRTEVKPCKTE